MKNEAEAQAERACEALLARKGLSPVIIDVRGLSSVTDFFVVCTGGSAPHLKALSAAVSRRWRDDGIGRVRTTGTVDSGWMVLDGLDVVVHLLSPELRERYAIEDLWSDAPRRTAGETAGSEPTS